MQTIRYTLFMIFTCASVTFAVAQTPITIEDPTTWSNTALKPYIGQTVQFDVPMYVTTNKSVQEQPTTISIAPRLLFTPTNQALPLSAEAEQVTKLNHVATLTLNNASGYRGTMRSGMKIYNLKARVTDATTLEYISGEWRGNSRSDLENTNIGAMVDRWGKEHTLLVCGMNIENYRLTEKNHAIQRQKVSAALAKIKADIFGLVEVGGGSAVMNELKDDLNRLTGFYDYEYIRDNTSDQVLQRSGYIYRTSKVMPLGEMQMNNTRVADRKRMQAFQEKGSGEVFIYSINHFKAKSGGGSGQDADQHDGQGGSNYSRVEEAKSVLREYSYERSYVSDPDILIMGDLNAHGKEDPITYFTKNGLTDLHRYYHADSSYSYIYMYSGLLGYLDHAIVNSTMLPQVTGMYVFHINSDENDNYAYDRSYADNTMFRCSDHDPVIVGLKLSATATEPTLSTENFIVAGDRIIIQNAIGNNKPAYYQLYDHHGMIYTEGEVLTDSYTIDETPSTPGIYLLIIQHYDDNSEQGTVYRGKVIVY